MKENQETKIQKATFYLSVAIVVLVLIVIVYNVIIKENTETIKNKLIIAQRTLESFNICEYM